MSYKDPDEYGPPNDTKYYSDGVHFVNRHTGEVIPLDEPVFILRAADIHAFLTIAQYGDMCSDSTHRDAIRGVLKRFHVWRVDNPVLMKEPDTPS